MMAGDMAMVKIQWWLRHLGWKVPSGVRLRCCMFSLMHNSR